MTDDIVTRLRLENYPLLHFGNHQDWCTALGIMDEAADEIERLRALLDNALERENKDNLRQLQIVRKVEADRDRWMKAAKALIRECGHDSHCPAWLKNPNTKWECECGFDKPLALYNDALEGIEQ